MICLASYFFFCLLFRVVRLGSQHVESSYFSFMITDMVSLNILLQINVWDLPYLFTLIACTCSICPLFDIFSNYIYISLWQYDVSVQISVAIYWMSASVMPKELRTIFCFLITTWLGLNSPLYMKTWGSRSFSLLYQIRYISCSGVYYCGKI